ncbi:MAG TPA: NUDIX hydrolase [Nevskiaceae bacterium]|nr:NUDIX hydrolase [Nevskiaceae bacterium]
MKYCADCGQPVEVRQPPGDHLPRHMCPACGAIHYRNPKLIVGVVPEWQDGRVLMCRRAIEPRLGLWTFPAGFMELGETSAQGAAREAFEEAGAEVESGSLLCVINVPYVNQVYLIHRGKLLAEKFHPTPESSEVCLMREDEIPWDEIAFPTIYRGLKYFFEDRASGSQGVHTLDLMQRPRPPQLAEVTSGA